MNTFCHLPLKLFRSLKTIDRKSDSLSASKPEKYFKYKAYGLKLYI